MTHKLKRVFALVVTFILCVSCIGTTIASAASFTITSGLSFEMNVKKTGSKSIDLCIDFTNNVELETLSFILYYDDKCTLSGMDLVNTDVGSCFDYPSDKMLVFSSAYTTPKTSDFSIIFHFTTSDSADNSHTFSMAIIEYLTSTKHETPVDMNFTIKTGDLYTIGDVNNDGQINSIDARDVLLIIEAGYTTVEKAENSITWIQNNICNIVCARAADANLDGKITSEDSDAILYYYASSMVYPDYYDDIIGSKYYTTIVA